MKPRVFRRGTPPRPAIAIPRGAPSCRVFVILGRPRAVAAPEAAGLWRFPPLLHPGTPSAYLPIGYVQTPVPWMGSHLTGALPHTPLVAGSQISAQ